MSFNCFSTNDTQDSAVVHLDRETSRQVIKELITGDYNKEEVKTLNAVISNLESKVIVKENIIQTQDTIIKSYIKIDKDQQTQIKLYNEINEDLKNKVEKLQTQNNTLTIGGVTLLVVTILSFIL